MLLCGIIMIAAAAASAAGLNVARVVTNDRRGYNVHSTLDEYTNI